MSTLLHYKQLYLCIISKVQHHFTTATCTWNYCVNKAAAAANIWCLGVLVQHPPQGWKRPYPIQMFLLCGRSHQKPT